MSASDSRPLPGASRYAVASAPVHQGRRWLRRLMVGIVLVYVGFLILAPITGLILGAFANGVGEVLAVFKDCLLYTSPSPRDRTRSRMPSSA